MNEKLDYAYCVVDHFDDCVVAIQKDDGDLSSLIETLSQFSDSLNQYSVVREPYTRAQRLLLEIHPDFEASHD
jgi:hypothetical protein